MLGKLGAENTNSQPVNVSVKENRVALIEHKHAYSVCVFVYI